MNEEGMIAIYPNTLGFGYVVLNDNGEILDYAMVSVRPVRNDKCLDRIHEMILYYQPKIIILEHYKKSNKSERVKKLLRSINDYGQDSLRIFKYSREQIRDTFEIFGAKNKYEVSKKVSEVYPQLNSKLPEKRKSWEPENYYQGIFDAMTLILTHNYLND